MNKNFIKLFASIIFASAIIVACVSGTNSTSSSSLSLVITPVTATPANSLPAQNLGAGMGTGSVYVNWVPNPIAGTPLYLLGNATGSVYASLTADTSFTTGTSIIGAWLTSPNILFGPAPAPSNVATYFTATFNDNNLPTNNSTITANWESATLTNVNRTICFGAPQAESNGCAGSNAPTGARVVISSRGESQFMFVGYGQPGILNTESIGYNPLTNNNGLGSESANQRYISLASCVESGSASSPSTSATVVSAVAASSFKDNPLFIGGTNSGDVCLGVMPATPESTSFESATVVNLTQIAKTNGASYNYESSLIILPTAPAYQVQGGYNGGGAVNAIAATPQTPSNTNTIIAWTQGSSKVYSATLNNSSVITVTPLTANITNLQFAQIGGAGSSYNNAPTANVSVIYVDFNNNIYVGTFINQVYVLPNGSTSWLSGTIPSTSGLIHNFSAGYNGNVYAYTANGTTSAVYSLTLQ